MKTGTIKFFKTDKGFGFITTDDNEELFFHISGLVDQNVNKGDRVTFDVKSGVKGLNAVDIKKA